jgi:stearoyl-CoA desaturase (delta-9 desaturase)
MKEAKATLSSLKPAEKVERLAQLVMKETKASLPNAGRIVGKIAAIALVGFTITSSCCSSPYLVPFGVVILAIAAGWLDAIGNECSCQRFFPSKSLNSIGSSLFRWQWVVFWTCVIFSLSFLRSGAPVRLSQLTMNERLWLVSVMAGIPLMLMLICRAVEPFSFNRARADIKKAEILVRQLAAKHSDSDVNSVAPLIEAELVPLYKLASVAKVLYDIAATYDAQDKLRVDLTQSQGSSRRWSFVALLSIVYAPFRTVANNLLLWECEDIMLYAVIAVYFFAVYLGSAYLPWAPLVPFCLLAPFFGPKSRASKYLRSLQEDIRLAQGRNAEKKGGMEPDPLADDWKCTINWPMVIYIGGSHLAALYALVVLIFFGGVCPMFATEPVKRVQLYMFIVIYICGGFGITAGAHRLWAHNSYKAGLPLRFVLMIFNSIANQGTIFHWARDHRLHHKYSDTIADPHDANRGFFFSHVGWLLVKKNPAVVKTGKTVNIEDLKKDGCVMFQKKADPFWNLMWCFAFPAFTSLMLGDTLWNGFLFCGVLRYCANLNATWAVNSVVHAFGNRPYNPSHLTTENGWVSLFALGEGWHNWHHAFAWDYATSELGPLLQFNPTKVLIDVLAFVGLAWDRKRAHGVWETRKARWEQEQGRPVVESLEGPPFFKHRVISFGPELYGEDNQPEPADMKVVEQ